MIDQSTYDNLYAQHLLDRVQIAEMRDVFEQVLALLETSSGGDSLQHQATLSVLKLLGHGWGDVDLRGLRRMHAVLLEIADLTRPRWWCERCLIWTSGPPGALGPLAIKHVCTGCGSSMTYSATLARYESLAQSALYRAPALPDDPLRIPESFLKGCSDGG